jgi:hypothetical protein
MITGGTGKGFGSSSKRFTGGTTAPLEDAYPDNLWGDLSRGWDDFTDWLGFETDRPDGTHPDTVTGVRAEDPRPIGGPRPTDPDARAETNALADVTGEYVDNDPFRHQRDYDRANDWDYQGISEDGFHVLTPDKFGPYYSPNEAYARFGEDAQSIIADGYKWWWDNVLKPHVAAGGHWSEIDSPFEEGTMRTNNNLWGDLHPQVPGDRATWEIRQEREASGEEEDDAWAAFRDSPEWVQMEDRLAQDEETINDLKAQIEELNNDDQRNSMAELLLMSMSQQPQQQQQQPGYFYGTGWY